MFETLKAQPADKILALVQAYREDPRDTKIDLGVGVYKDASGNTPVMRAVKAAEQRIWENQDTKAYTGLAGDPAYSNAMAALVLGDAVPRGAIAAAATPGGTGAVRQAFELGWPTPKRAFSSLTRHGRTTCRSCPIWAWKWSTTAISIARPAA